MSTLYKTQELFFRCVRFDPAPKELETVFAPSGRLSARECMAIYRNMYWFRMVDALFDVFPRLSDHLGREKFTRLACRYLAAEPSRFPELERVGHALASYVREHEEDILRSSDRMVLGDLAELEFTSLEVLLSPTAAAAVSLANVDHARFAFQTLRLTPAHALVQVRGEALELFEAQAPPSSSPDSTDPSRHVLIFRPHFGVLHRTVDADEANAIRRAREGCSVEQVCMAFASPERASSILRRWFDAGLIVELAD